MLQRAPRGSCACFFYIIIFLTIAIGRFLCYNKRMKTGISTASLFPRYNSEDAIAKLIELGAENTELFYSTFYEYRPEFSAKLAAAAKGLDVHSVHTVTANFEPQLFSPSFRVQGDGYYWCDQVLRSAQLLGCRNYTFHGFHRLKNSSRGDDYDGYAAVFERAIEFFSRYGVRLCLENVAWCAYNRPGFFKQIKARCPDLLGVFDIKQARNSGYPYQMYIEEMAGAISHVHLSDISNEGKMCLPGRGVYDFEEIVKRLRGAGFDGCALVEVYGGDYGELGELKDSLDYLGEIIYKHG